MKNLIINADEFGLTKGVNRAIIDAYQFGTVTSTTMMVNMWAFEDAIRLSEENPDLGIGIHLNLTDGKPVLPIYDIPDLVNQRGCFINRKTLWKKVTISKLLLSQIANELNAQLYIIKHAGINITHIDVHQAVDLHPKIFPIVLNLSNKLNVPLRITRQGLIFRVLGRENVLKRCFSRIVCNQYIKLANLANVAHTDYFFKLMDYSTLSNGSLQAKWKSFLKMLTEGFYELMVHPSYVDNNLISFMSNSSVMAKNREKELEILLNQEIKEFIRQFNINLINFRHIHK